MALNFPANPTVGQVFSTGTSEYIYNGVTWQGRIVTDQFRANDWLTYEALKFTVQNNGVNVYTVPSVLNFIGNAISVTNEGSVITINVFATVSSGGGGGGTGDGNSYVYISDNVAPTLSNGGLWWNSSDATLYVRYIDQDSSQWVTATPTFKYIPTFNTFSVISVAGQESVVATNVSTNVQFIAGNGVTIATNALSNTLTFTTTNNFGTVSIAGQDNIIAAFPGDNLVFVAGDYLNLTTDASNINISTSLHPSFNTIVISGQTEVIANSAMSNLTLIAGSQIILTSNASNGSITVTSTGVSTGKAIAMAIVFGG